MNEVLIVEDHPFVAEATKELLSRAYPLVSTTVRSNASAAIEALTDPNRTWHRILLDLDIPGAHGLSVATEIQRQGLAGIACVVTATHRSDYVAQIKAMGFLGYIVKATPVDEFAAALGKIFVGVQSFATLPEGAQVRHEVVRLTRRQAQILDLVRTGSNSKQIGRSLKLTEGTVNNHINAAMSALEVSTRSHAVAKAIECGMLGFGTLH